MYFFFLMVHGNAAEILSLPRQAFDNMTFIVFEEAAAVSIDRWISGVDTSSASAV